MLISHLYILHKRDNCALPGRNGENTGGADVSLFGKTKGVWIYMNPLT
jgi:hypothetical protein